MKLRRCSVGGFRRNFLFLEFDSVGFYRPDYIFQRLYSKRSDRNVNFPIYLIEHDARNAHASRLGKALQPRCDVYAIAKKVIAPSDYITKMDSDPKPERSIFR